MKERCPLRELAMCLLKVSCEGFAEGASVSITPARPQTEYFPRERVMKSVEIQTETVKIPDKLENIAKNLSLV